MDIATLGLAVYHSALPSRLGCTLTAGRRPQGEGGGGPEVDPRHPSRRPAAWQQSRRSLPMVETGTCCRACCCKQLATTTTSGRLARCGITHMYSTVRNRTKRILTAGRRSQIGQWARASTDGKRVSDLSGLATLRMSWVPRGGPLEAAVIWGRNCHLPHAATVEERQNDGTKSCIMQCLSVGEEWRGGVREAHSRRADFERVLAR